MCVYATVSSIWSMLSVLHIPVQISYGYAFLFLSHPLSPQCRPSKGRKRGHCWCVDKYGQSIPGYEEKEKVHCYNMETKWRGEREAERWKQGDKEGYLPLRTTWIQIQKCCPKADLPLVCWGMDSRDQQLTLHFRRVGRTRGGDRERVSHLLVLDCIPRGKCEHNQKYKQISVAHAKSEHMYSCVCEGRCVLVPCASVVSLFRCSVYWSLPWLSATLS